MRVYEFEKTNQQTKWGMILERNYYIQRIMFKICYYGKNVGLFYLSALLSLRFYSYLKISYLQGYQ